VIQRDESITTAHGFYEEALNKMSSTQCGENESGEDQPDQSGLRTETERFTKVRVFSGASAATAIATATATTAHPDPPWPQVPQPLACGNINLMAVLLRPQVEGETDMNPEGGFCGMPTQFLGTVRVGGQHRVPRWVSNTQNMLRHRGTGETPPPIGETVVPIGDDRQRTTNRFQLCGAQVKMYIPWELLTIADVALPESAALQRFEEIAWDCHDRTDSLWDGCEVGCDIPIQENQLCGGSGLSEYDWTLPYCSRGVSDGGHICCAASCGDCAVAGCEGREGGEAACCPATITVAERECRSSWDSGCLIPRRGDGGSCLNANDCLSGDCRTGRCCNAYGQSEGCTVRIERVTL
jgi:hypothetical protein